MFSRVGKKSQNYLIMFVSGIVSFECLHEGILVSALGPHKAKLEVNSRKIAPSV